MENILGKISLIATLLLFLMPFTPIILIWFTFTLFAKIAGTIAVIIIALGIIRWLIDWGSKD